MSEQEKTAQKIYEMLLVQFSGKKLQHSEVVAAAESLYKVVCTERDGDKAQMVAIVVQRYEENVSIIAYDPEVLTDGQYDPNSWVYDKRDHIKHDYFSRYRLYLRRDGFAEDAISKIERTSENILSFCADPNINVSVDIKQRHKKGLVVGDVQSGKTANYLGLINAACDYGYKIIVLLAGATNSLRQQTQGRMDAGVVGAKSETIGSDHVEFIGVGEDVSRYFAVPLTNSVKDFVKSTKLANNSSPDDYNKPVVFVVKKNVSVLRAMKDWLKPGQIKADNANGIFIIDDESDYASVNTARPENDPTKINALIRDLYNNFPIATYVGFTATPFANVFINPYADDTTYEDLFPSNFIIQLIAPNNYFGYKKVFSDNESERRHLVVLDENEENFLPVLHKKDIVFSELPRSMKDAILCFVISNVIRTKRGQPTKHRSMMINISWLNAVQGQINDAVSNYVQQLKQIVAQDSTKPLEKFLRNEEMARLYEIFTQDSFYDEIRNEISFEELQKMLYDEVKLFETAIINSKVKAEERFDYEARKTTGARVIIIGGFVLSRGLTLEGLIISYYSRSASAYDTLLQMCRWFGYRPKFEDLCRIYIIESAIHEFEAVIWAVENLKTQFHRMALERKTPEQFGIMVREYPESMEMRSLHPSARNKMRHTVQVERYMNFGGVYTDTSKLFKDSKWNAINKQAAIDLIKGLSECGLMISANKPHFVRNVPAHLVADLMSKIKIPLQNVTFSGENIADYIRQQALNQDWDVLIASSSSQVKVDFGGVPVEPIQRSFDKPRDKEDFIRVSGKNNRLSEPGMFKVGLTQAQYEQAVLHARERNKTQNANNKEVTPVAIDFLAVENRPPLLIIFPIDLKTKKHQDDAVCVECEKFKSTLNGELMWGFGVGFPATEKGTRLKFRLNLIKRDEQLQIPEVESDTDYEEEEDD